VTPIERDCPAGWTPAKITRLERTEHGLIAQAWEIARDGCDCVMLLGVRVDNGQVTFGINPCDQHGTIVEQTLMKLRMMVGTERQIHALAGEIFEAKLAKAGVA
jgi:hypothetical protein